MKLYMVFLSLSLPFTRVFGFQNKAFLRSIHGLGTRALSSHKLFARQKKNADSKTTAAELYKPRTENQALYVKYLTDISTPIVVGVGPAGSGKTLFACNQAVAALRAGFVQKIILTRPIVPVEEDIGFLPGSLINKMDPWTRPIFDILLEFYPQKDIDSMLHNGVLEISPLAYMRGRTFKRAFVIADEMQNSSPNQMLMLTTRIGEQSKLVITGDLAQSDRSAANGLADFIGKIRAYEKTVHTDLVETRRKHDKESLGIRIVEMENQDIQRSPIVAKLLKIYGGGTTVPPTTPSLPGGNVGERGGVGLGEKGGVGLGEKGGARVGERGGARVGVNGGVGIDQGVDDILAYGVEVRAGDNMNSTSKGVFWKNIYCSVEDTIFKNVATNTTSIHNTTTTNATVNISLNNIPGVVSHTAQLYKNIPDNDAALIPLRSNITKSNYYPWKPMDI
jgi:phosphate starvation-inducible PhoH-like protein